MTDTSRSHSPSARIRVHIIRLLDEHRPMLLGFAFALCGDHHVAEDAVQECGCIVAAHPERVPQDAVEAARWLRAVVRNKALELGRHHRRQRTELASDVLDSLALTFDQTDHEGDDPATSHHRQMRLAMLDCVDALGGDARQVMQRRYVGGDSCETIAQALGRSVQGVYSLLKRVRLSLMDCVEQRVAAIQRSGP